MWGNEKTKNDKKNTKKSTLVNAGQRCFDPGQNAAKRGQRGQGGGDIIAGVTGSANGFGSGSVRVARATCVASEWIGLRVGCDRVGRSVWKHADPGLH